MKITRNQIVGLSVVFGILAFSVLIYNICLFGLDSQEKDRIKTEKMIKNCTIGTDSGDRQRLVNAELRRTDIKKSFDDCVTGVRSKSSEDAEDIINNCKSWSYVSNNAINIDNSYGDAYSKLQNIQASINFCGGK